MRELPRLLDAARAAAQRVVLAYADLLAAVPGETTRAARQRLLALAKKSCDRAALEKTAATVEKWMAP